MRRLLFSDDRPLRGVHVLAMLVAFFGVIIGVNILMATFAVRTFPGLWAKNGYNASQNYNRLLREAEQSAGRHWHASVGEDKGRLVLHLRDQSGQTPRIPELSAIAGRPGSEREDTELLFFPRADGFLADAPLAPGRWVIAFEARDGETLLWRESVSVTIARRPAGAAANP